MLKAHTKNLALAIVLVSSVVAFGADYYVNNVIGNDAFDGKAAAVAGQSGPMATINKAVKLLQPADALHLANTGKVYRQSLDMPGTVSGTAERKITIDGHGAWLTGADHLPVARWIPAEQGPEGTLQLTGLKGRYDFGIGLLLDGEKVKGFDDPDALKPGEFWYLPKTRTLYYLTPDTFGQSSIVITQEDGKTVEAQPAKWGGTNHRHIHKLRRFRGLSSSPQSILVDGKDASLLKRPALDNLLEGRSYMDGTELYYRPPAGKTLADLKMMAVIRPNGVAINGANEHLVIKNLNVVYVTNDGYNIHGATKDVFFSNCNTFFAGDEGYSSHDRCETTLDGGIYLQCSNGIHNVNDASTIIRNVIVDNAGLRNDRASIGTGIRPNVVENAILIDCPLGTTETKVDNLLTVNRETPKEGSTTGMRVGTDVTLKRVTLTGRGRIRLDAKSKGSFADCLFAFESGDVHVRAASPEGIVSFKDCLYTPNFTMEWGTGHPFTRVPFAQWSQEHPGLAAGNKAVELNLTQGLKDGKVPENAAPGVGCSKELLQRYLEFVPKHQAMIDEALKIVWARD